jgi:hypothetical protein
MPPAQVVAWPSVVAFALALSDLACSTSAVEGPQVTRVPPGYGFSSQMSGARNVFLDDRPTDEFGWMRVQGETHGSIEINVYDGSRSESEIRGARDAHAERWEHAAYDEVASTTIDGRPAWWWFVRQERSRECVAVVPHDDVTFTIEYHSAFREEQDDEAMRAVVASFRREPGRLGRVLIPVLLVAGIGAGVVAIWRMRGSGR